jgi:hypothetical protein
LFLLIGGCNQPLPPPPPAFWREPVVPDPERRHSPSDRTDLLAELERQKATWYRQAPDAYELKVSRLCLCDPGTPWVSRNEGSAVVSSSGGHFRDGRSVGPPLRNVEQVFAEARRAAESEADEVSVAFDPLYGYPMRIIIDRWRHAVDDELTLYVDVTALR